MRQIRAIKQTKELKMKTMLLKLSALILLATSLMACSRESIDSNFLATNVNGGNNIYRSYRLDHSEDKNESLALATLSVGSSYGSTVRLVSPASISINGTPAREKSDTLDGGELSAFFLGFLFPPAWLLMNTSGTNYHQRVYDKVAIFEFVDMNGKTFTDSARVPTLYLSIPSVVPSSGFTVSAAGASASGSTMTVQLKQGNSTEIVSGSAAGVQVESHRLSRFGAGPIEVSVQVEQTQKIPSNRESLGGEIKTSYAFSTRQITVR